MVGMNGSSSGSHEYGRYAAEKLAKEYVTREFSDFMVKCGSELEALSQLHESLSNESANQVICLDSVPTEDLSLVNLVRSDHEELRKVVLALGHLVSEMDFLIGEGRSFYYPILYYGEGVDEKTLQAGESHVCAGRMVETLQKLLNFVNHCYKVIKNVVGQLSRLYCSSNAGPKYFEVGDTHFKIIFERMGCVLSVLVNLDSIINRNNLLREHVAQLQHVVRSIQHNASNFDTTPEDLRLLDLSLDEITEKTLSGTLFLRCVTQSFPTNNNKVLLDEVSANIKGFLEELSFRLDKEGERDNLENMQKFLNVVCLFVLHAHLGLRVDNRQLKTILDVAKNSIVAVPLVGSCLWFPDQFLSLYLPRGDRAVDAKMLENVASARFQYVRQRSQQLAKDLQTWNTKIVLWLSRLSGQHVNSQEELTNQCCLVLQGLRYVSRLSGVVRLILNLHLAIQPVISKGTVVAAFQTFELIKTLQKAIEKQLTEYPQAWLHLQQQLRRSVLEVVQLAARKLASEQNNKKRPRKSIGSALALAERTLAGPCTTLRASTIRISLAIACTAFRDEELSLLAHRLQKMELMSIGIRHRLAELADCEMFYWHKSLINTYLPDARERRIESSRLGKTLLAAMDCQKALGSVKHLSNPSQLVDSHQQFIRRALELHILEPLCAAVETELRIQSHAHLHPTARNPFKEPPCLNTLGDLPLGPHEQVNVPHEVEQYLGKTFYNLAALASHDWRKYGQMRILAGSAFNLKPLPDRLPSQTLEQGLDVLEIMRNIHLFVARFGYNLNNQFFVEQSSTSKHLSTIGIKHAANSIRTHGSGVVNTAVNFTYQFLRKKFFVFSQFLYDEHIKSRLMKDARYLRELSEGKDSALKYPYERAEKFHRGIRKLGLNSIGLSYLDQFRILITHLGNALGYVRMLRSGSIHCSAESCAPVPDLAELVYLNESGVDHQLGSSSSSLKNHNDTMDMADGLFESLAKANPALSSLSELSSKALDKVLDDLAQNLSESSDYFKLLVDVFRPFFRDPRHSHLRHFYVIVPPVTVNYVEHIVTCKEKLTKKNKQETSTFTDDGLAMGLAYCLSVLNQWKDFDALQWFSSVSEFFERERKNAGLQSQASQDTLSLTLHRLDTYQQEFQLLFYNLNSARIFFRHERPIIPVS
ncbi:hypothetical protein GHT06_014682 [Daphnia sinensis]|uniref:WASH complex subunit 7 n=1 Tax=Daphnia sinensis TaxID=1820382 RepID=A0AAD5L9P7_9CRUS|nr:hypothetical protein GHT06_014682 [Daphnia sinensis]